MPLCYLNHFLQLWWTRTEWNNTDYTDWATEAGDRLQVAATLLLLVGSVAFVWAIHLILYEDQWVAKIVLNFPKHSKPADDGIKGPPGDIDPKDTMTTIPGRIIDSDSQQQQWLRIGLSFLKTCQNWNTEFQIFPEKCLCLFCKTHPILIWLNAVSNYKIIP